MNRKAKKQIILGGALLIVFALYTLSLTFMTVQPIGPRGSFVAYANINHAVHELFGVHMFATDMQASSPIIRSFMTKTL